WLSEQFRHLCQRGLKRLMFPIWPLESPLICFKVLNVWAMRIDMQEWLYVSGPLLAELLFIYQIGNTLRLERHRILQRFVHWYRHGNSETEFFSPVVGEHAGQTGEVDQRLAKL